jgi:hypothetical protein
MGSGLDLRFREGPRDGIKDGREREREGREGVKGDLSSGPPKAWMPTAKGKGLSLSLSLSLCLSLPPSLSFFLSLSLSPSLSLSKLFFILQC